jgi:membrane protease YdiL (CAAX protease family)
MLSINYGIDIFLLLTPVIFYFFKYKKISIKNIFNLQGLKKINIFDLIKKSLLLLLLLLIFSYLLNFIAFIFNISDVSLVSESILKIPFLLIMYLFIVRVFLEEWFFRSFLLRKTNIFIATLIFALAHISYGSVIEFLGAFALGFTLCVFYRKTKNIYPNFIAHSLYNIIVYSILINFM